MHGRIKYLFGLELTSEEAEIIEKIHAERQALIKYPETLLSLVEDWSTLVEDLKEGYGFSIFDFTNDLDGRRVIDRLLPACPHRIQSKILEMLAPLDEQFFELTEPKENPNLSPLDRDKWSRMPKDPQGDMLEFLILHNLRKR